MNTHHAAKKACFARLVQPVAAITLFIGAWLSISAFGDAAVGPQPTVEPRPPAFASKLLFYAGTFCAFVMLVQLPFTVMGLRQIVAYLRDNNKEDRDGAGLMGLVIGAVTRWRLRLEFAAGAALVTFVVALVTLTTSINFSELRKVVNSFDGRNQTQVRVSPIDISALDCAIICGVLLILLVKARGLMEVASLPLKFQYRNRSPRIGRAIVHGMRNGLSATAIAIFATPIVLGNYEIALGIDTFARWSKGSQFGWLGGRLNRLAALIAGSPPEAAIVLAVLPLTCVVLLDRSLKRFVALDGDEWALAHDLHPALYLRSWEADQIRVRAPALRRGAVEHFAPPRRISFAELVGESAERQAPLLATGKPDTRRRLSGIGSMWLTEESWRDSVRVEAANALCVVLTADSVSAQSGYAWELELTGTGHITERLVVVFPPELTVSQARGPRGFLTAVADLPVFHDLTHMDLSDETVVVARAKGHPWKAYTTAVRTDGSYCLCIMEALDHFTKAWEAELVRSNNEGRSVERVLREEYLAEYREHVVAVLVGWAVKVFRALSASAPGRKGLSRSANRARRQ